MYPVSSCLPSPISKQLDAVELVGPCHTTSGKAMLFPIVLFVSQLFAFIKPETFKDKPAALAALQDKLLTGKNRLVRPVRNRDDVLKVKLWFDILHIELVDEMHQTMTVNGLFSIAYDDYKMRWNAEDYMNITSLVVRSFKVWLPDLHIPNSASGQSLYGYWRGMVYIQGGEKDSTSASVYGTAQATLKVTCNFDFSRYPYDVQKCPIVVWSHMYDVTQVELISSDLEAGVEAIEFEQPTVSLSWGDPELESKKRHVSGWELVNTSMSKVYWNELNNSTKLPIVGSQKDYYPVMEFWLTLKRHSPYYGALIVVPLFFSTIITIFALLIKRPALRTLTFLLNTTALGLFSIDLLVKLPPTAGDLPKIVVYFGIHLVLTVMGLILVDTAEWLEETELGEWLKTIFNATLLRVAKICHRETNFQPQINEDENWQKSESAEPKQVEPAVVDHWPLKFILFFIYVPIYMGCVACLFDV